MVQSKLICPLSRPMWNTEPLNSLAKPAIRREIRIEIRFLIPNIVHYKNCYHSVLQTGVAEVGEQFLAEVEQFLSSFQKFSPKKYFQAKPIEPVLLTASPLAL